MRISSIIVISIFSLFTLSCGQTNQERLNSEMFSAEIDLTRGDCDSALSKLLNIGRQGADARYVKLLASSYACKAGYRSTTFFSDDLPLVAAGNLLSSFTLFSTSDAMDSPTEVSFTYLQSAIDTLLYAGNVSSSVNPTAENRKTLFTSKESAQIHSFLLFTVMAQIGKYSYFYGNTTSTGQKGLGANSNECFMEYDAAILAAMGGGGGECDDAADTGHPDLDVGTVNFERGCQGVVLLNTFLDVIPEVISSATGTDFSVLDGIDFDVIKTAAAAALTAAGKSTDILDITSQTRCEADITDEDTMRIYFAMFYDLLHNKT